MRKASLAKRVGTQIRLLRLQADLSQEEFAHRCGFHRTYAGALERGEKTMTITTAEKICKVFDLTLSEFFALID